MEVCGSDDGLLLNILPARTLMEMHRPLEIHKLRALPLASASSYSKGDTCRDSTTATIKHAKGVMRPCLRVEVWRPHSRKGRCANAHDVAPSQFAFQEDAVSFVYFKMMKMGW
jgi:hypothetical protein